MTEDTQIIMNTIEKLADKLGIAVSEVARIFIQAQTAIGIVNVIAAAFIIITSIAVGYMVGRNTYKSDGTLDSSLFAGFFMGMTWMLIFALISTFVLPSIYMIVAPEYMGLKDMIMTLRP